LEFAKTESIVTVQRRFRTMYAQNHIWTKQFVSGTWNSSRVAACALRNEEAGRGHRKFRRDLCITLYTVDKNVYQITNNSKHLRNPVAKVIFHVAIPEPFCEFK